MAFRDDVYRELSDMFENFVTNKNVSASVRSDAMTNPFPPDVAKEILGRDPWRVRQYTYNGNPSSDAGKIEYAQHVEQLPTSKPSHLERRMSLDPDAPIPRAGEYLMAEQPRGFSKNPSWIDTEYGKGGYVVKNATNARSAVYQSGFPWEREHVYPKGQAFRVDSVKPHPEGAGVRVWSIAQKKHVTIPSNTYELSEASPVQVKNAARSGATVGRLLSVAPYILSALKYADPEFRKMPPMQQLYELGGVPYSKPEDFYA